MNDLEIDKILKSCSAKALKFLLENEDSLNSLMKEKYNPNKKYNLEYEEYYDIYHPNVNYDSIMINNPLRYRLSPEEAEKMKKNLSEFQ